MHHSRRSCSHFVSFSQFIDHHHRSKDDQSQFLNRDSNSLSVHRTSSSMQLSICFSVCLHRQKRPLRGRSISVSQSTTNKLSPNGTLSWFDKSSRFNLCNREYKHLFVSIIFVIDRKTISFNFFLSGMNEILFGRASPLIVKTISFHSSNKDTTLSSSTHVVNRRDD